MPSEPFRVITQAESWKQEVQADVVERIRELLERAEAGEIQGFAYAAVCTDNLVLTSYTKTERPTSLIGGLARIQHHILADEG